MKSEIAREGGYARKKRQKDQFGRMGKKQDACSRRDRKTMAFGGVAKFALACEAAQTVEAKLGRRGRFVPPRAEQKFIRVRDAWKTQRGHEPSTMKAVMLPAYQQIIGMGPVAVPLLLRELKANIDNWFWALM